MRHIVIMAGGSGTRFWPASRKHRPKQFLSIGSGDHSLLRQTFERVLPLVEASRVWVVTGALHAEHARSDLPELPKGNVLVEPEGRNTAPCIAWSTQVILDQDPEARIAVLPADHHIGDEDGFRAYLSAAFDACETEIVLFGIVPTRPDTGYGYIERADEVKKSASKMLCKVSRFVEKPDLPTAKTYLESGRYLWNSGMFVFSGKLMDGEVKAHLPELHQGVTELMNAPDRLDALYPKLPSISIDYGVMERSERTLVMPVAFDWNDVGSWEAAQAVYPADDAGNVMLGDVQAIDMQTSMVDARSGRLVAVVGLEDVVVVDTPDAVLVMDRKRSQDVKKIVEALKSAQRNTLL